MITKNILRVHPNNVEKTIYFYSKLFGMKYEEIKITNNLYLPDKRNINILHNFYYNTVVKNVQPTKVCFIEDVEFKTSYQNSGYWKIGIALQNVNAAVEYLQQNNVEINKANQFFYVGFLTSCLDPNGYSIELLQHDFESNFSQSNEQTILLNQPISSQPHLGQITLRNSSQEITQNFYTDILGMRLLCVEMLTKHNMSFNLYFYAYSEANPPNSDLNAVENREWLYRQSFTQIEFQHRLNLQPSHQYVTNDKYEKIGHVGIEIEVSEAIFKKLAVNNHFVKVESENAFSHKLYDPDGYTIYVKINEH